MKKRKITSSILCVLFAFLLLFSACGKTPSTGGPEGESESGGAVDVTYDYTGKYVLAENGEAVMKTDVSNFSEIPKENNNRVFYEIFVGSFSDSDGDGIGDLRGIISRMDYLNDGDPASGLSLGVDGIWLTPIFKSPSYHKYNITDYYTIDPAFGTMDDLKELISLCHERNVKIILDLPLNHTGKLHPWFSEFVKARRDEDYNNPYFNYYTCYANPNNTTTAEPGDAENDAFMPYPSLPPAGITTTPVPGTDIVYECNFSDEMPELNFDNEAVFDDTVKIAEYYLDLGVDGFRFDAAKFIYYGDNEKNAEFWDKYMAALRKIKPDIYTVAEVWDADTVTDKYYTSTNCFNFSISQSEGLIAETAKKGDVNRYTSYVEKYLKRIESIRKDSIYMPFIANHDTDRAAGYLTQASGTSYIAANIYLLGPGSPFIYYGEEVGMRGSRGGANTDANRRLAMPWGDGDTVKNPEGTTYSSTIVDYTVTEQMGNGSSLYSYYKKVLMLRHAYPEIANGTYSSLDLTGTKAGGFVSSYNGSTIAVLHNTSTNSVTLNLSDIGDGSFQSVDAFIGVEEASIENGQLILGGQTSVILK